MTGRKQSGGRRHRSKGPRPDGSTPGPTREKIQELSPSLDAPDIKTFEEWPLNEETQGAIRAMDITVPTPIQKLAIGPVLEGRDVIAKAETGTGKTLAFGAPMMSKIDPARSTVLGLVLCPTRELAQQVAQVLEALALPRGVKVALVVGGDPMQPQVTALQSGAQVVVGTPGRVLDLYQQRFLSFPWTEFVVLDEADKMFEIGFLDDIRKILNFTPEERQTLLFSATFPTEVLKLARGHTRNPAEVATALGTKTVESIAQYYVELDGEEDRVRVLANLLRQSEKRDVFLIFCERRTDVDKLLRRMERSPYTVKALHGGYDQASRFRVMSAFRTGEVKVLIATDVASRGLDVVHVSHVINLGVPREIEDYTHRVGRTGRAGRDGTAVTMVVPADRRRWSALLGRAKWTIEKMSPEGLPKPGAKAPRDEDAREEREERPRADRRPRDRGDEGGRGREDREEERPRSRRRTNDKPSEDRDERPRREPVRGVHGEEEEERIAREKRAAERRAQRQQEEQGSSDRANDKGGRPRAEGHTEEARPRRPRRSRRPRRDEQTAEDRGRAGEERPTQEAKGDREERSPTGERRPRRARQQDSPKRSEGREENRGRSERRESRPPKNDTSRKPQEEARSSPRANDSGDGGGFGAGL